VDQRQQHMLHARAVRQHRRQIVERVPGQPDAHPLGLGLESLGRRLHQLVRLDGLQLELRPAALHPRQLQ
jgi:hypothetical protein